MAYYTLSVIEQLQQGNRDKVDLFETNIFENLKQLNTAVVVQREKEDSSDDQYENESRSSSYSDSEEEYDAIEKEEKPDINKE